MINIDERILSKVTGDEMWLLIQITKRLGRNHYCFPSNETLMRDTKWKIDKLRSIKHSLVDKGFLAVEIVEGRSNIYRVTTDFIGVFVGADKLSETPSEKPTGSEKPTPPHRKNQQTTPSEKPTGKYYQSEVLISNSIGADASSKKSLEERREAFKETIKPHVEEFGREMCNRFYAYWSEANGKKMRFEYEKTWEIHKRLLRWKARDDERKLKAGARPPDTPLVASDPKSYHTTPQP